MEASPKYYIRPIPLTKMVRDMSQWTYQVNAGQMVTTGIYVWYIENSEPKVLVDAGILGEQYSAYGLTAEPIQSLESGLEKLGLKPEDIGIIIFTHLHFDHSVLAPRYPNAKFIVQKKELDATLGREPRAGVPDDREMIRGLNLEVVDGDKEIIKGVKVMLTPGHSVGGQSVAVDTPKGLAIIAGLCTIGENFDPPLEIKARGIKVIAPGNNFDPSIAYDSVLRIKETADIVLALHDSEFMEKDRVP